MSEMPETLKQLRDKGNPRTAGVWDEEGAGYYDDGFNDCYEAMKSRERAALDAIKFALKPIPKHIDFVIGIHEWNVEHGIECKKRFKKVLELLEDEKNESKTKKTIPSEIKAGFNGA